MVIWRKVRVRQIYYCRSDAFEICFLEDLYLISAEHVFSRHDVKHDIRL